MSIFTIQFDDMTEERIQLLKKVEEMLYGDICEYYLLAVEEFVPYAIDDGEALIQTGYMALEKILSGTVRFPFNKEDYYRNTDIQDSLVALGIDSEKFWYAVLFIHHCAESKCVNVIELPKTSTRQEILMLLECLGEEEAKITFTSKNRKPFVISRNAILRTLSDIISIGYETTKDKEELDYIPINFQEMQERKEYAVSYQIAYEAKVYKSLLAKISRTSSEVEDFKKGSRDKLLLTSRLMYFTGLTRNESYLSGTDSIKGLIKSYKNKNMTGISGEYLI